MSLVLLISVVVGIVFGRFLLPATLVPHLGDYAYWTLLLVLLGVGLELGQSQGMLRRLRGLPWRSLLLPFTSALGTLTGGALAGWVLGLGLISGMAVGAGFGWYSLSSVILAEFTGAELAAVAFLANVFRELVAIVFIPLLFRWRLGIAAITPGGATTMDTTLAVVSRSTQNPETTVLAFYHGFTLSMLVPIIVPFLARYI